VMGSRAPTYSDDSAPSPIRAALHRATLFNGVRLKPRMSAFGGKADIDPYRENVRS